VQSSRGGRRRSGRRTAPADLKVGLSILLLCAAPSCRRAAPENEGPRPVGVTVQTARADTLRDVATASGVVVPSAAGDLTIYAPEAAQVVELPKKEQDPVAAGDLLVRFEIPSLTQELAARELAVVEATQRADRAKADLARVSTLFERGIAPRNTYEQARVEQTTTESQRGQAVAALAATKADSARATVHARFPGVVMKVWRTEGEFVRGGVVDPILQVIDPSRLQVAVELPIAQLARILPGQTATVRAIAGDATITATVAQKPGMTDPSAPTGQVRLSFLDPTATLTLEAPVSVEILIDQRTAAIIVPVAAIQKDDLSSYVMLAGEDQRAHRRDVRTGLVTRDFAQVTSGLQAGERIIVGGLSDVSDGTPISFVE